MWYTKELNQIFNELNARQGGLTEDEASKRLEKYGANNLKEKKKESLFIKFIKQFNDFMIIVLIIAAIISAIVAKTNGSGDYIDSIIIIAIVIFNAIMGLIQEEKAEKSLEALKKMSAPNAKVRRNGKIQEIEASQVVPGDVVILEAGNYVPADCRLIDSYNLQIEESSLTGETLPTSKQADVILNANTAIGDLKNMAFATTIVVNGHAEAVVVETGMNTKVGQIAGMIIENESPETPLQKKLGEVGKTLAITCMIICGLIFLIGIWQQIPITEMFMTSVGLAVAAIPEGLPAIVTIMLSIGVTKMAKRNSIIRKLPAVETLGSSTVICSDKTGTLTQNKMKVVKIEDLNTKITEENKKNILKLACMCTDCTINEKNVDGEPTEVAIVNAALEVGENKNNIYKIEKRVNEIPFDSERKLMTTIHKVGNRYRIITKGAPDVLIKKCKKIYNNEKIEDLTNNNKATILNKNDKMAKEALRVIAVSYLDIDILPSKIDSNLENNLIFVGLIGMYDPPREGVKEAVHKCEQAGIKTVMITGDHIITAKAIAKELGILKLGGIAITGEELDRISQKDLEKEIMNYSVFARVSPEHKVRIVKAFQSKRKCCSNDRRPE